MISWRQYNPGKSILLLLSSSYSWGNRNYEGISCPRLLAGKWGFFVCFLFCFVSSWCAVAWLGISVPRPGTEPGPQWWKHHILTPRPLGNSFSSYYSKSPSSLKLMGKTWVIRSDTLHSNLSMMPIWWVVLGEGRHLSVECQDLILKILKYLIPQVLKINITSMLEIWGIKNPD